MLPAGTASFWTLFIPPRRGNGPRTWVRQRRLPPTARRRPVLSWDGSNLSFVWFGCRYTMVCNAFRPLSLYGGCKPLSFLFFFLIIVLSLAYFSHFSAVFLPRYFLIGLFLRPPSYISRHGPTYFYFFCTVFLLLVPTIFYFVCFVFIFFTSF